MMRSWRQRCDLWIRLLGAGLALSLTFPVSPWARITPAHYTYAFKEADLADVAEAVLGRALNLTYSVDSDLTAKITFHIDRSMTPAELLSAFESTLALQDIALVRNGQTLVLEKRSKARASSSVQTLDEGKHAIGYQTLAVPLTKAAPQDVAKALQSMGSGGVVSYVDEAHNQLVLTGTAQEVASAVQSIHLLDKEATGNQQMRWFPLHHAQAADVAQEMTELLKGARLDGLSVVAMKRLNGVYGFARTETGLNEIAGWVSRLDVASEDEANTLWIYHPRNASAEGLKAALGGVIGDASPDGRQSSATSRTEASRLTFDTSTAGGGAGLSGPFAGGGSGFQAVRTTTSSVSPSGPDSRADQGLTLVGNGVRIGVDKDTNALLIAATHTQWSRIEKILTELDQAPGQVLIEASIVEVTLTKDNSFGVNFSAIGSKHWNNTFSTNGSGTVAPSFPGLAITYLDGNLQAAVSALGTDSKIEVISAPKIITLDNKPASLNVGDQVPVVSQSAQSTLTSNTALVNTVDYRNTGVILKVTPRITGANSILLEVSQEVSSVQQTTSSDIDSPTIQQRQLESTLVLTDGGVVALGGMISSNRTSNSTGIPYLKDIPGLGLLFRSTTHNLDRTELVVLLTARIIRTSEDAERARMQLTGDMKELKTSAPMRP